MDGLHIPAGYKDRITGDQLNVLIDHILVSQGLKVIQGKVWNPNLEKDDTLIQSIRTQLIQGSDHFPVLVELEN